MSSETKNQESTKENEVEDEFTNCQRQGRRGACVDLECPCRKLKNEDSARNKSDQMECCIHSEKTQGNSNEKEEKT